MAQMDEQRRTVMPKLDSKISEVKVRAAQQAESALT